MQPATPQQFAGAPVGRYVTGEGFVHFCARPEAWGVLLWGRPNGPAIESLTHSLRLELDSPAVPHASIVDASTLSGVDAGAFAALDAYVRAHFERLRHQVQRLALVRPSGMEGAVVAGFFEVMARPYPVELFERRRDALAWAFASSDVEPLEAEIGALLDSVRHKASILRDLDAYLDSNLTDANVAQASKVLGLSERTLQRRLSEVGTTFLDALGEARVRASQRLMLDSDAPLTRVALEVGCASLQHFSALFRKRVGEPPSAWRAKHRGAAS